MVFVIFAVAALSIDLGFVMLTRRQMQAAANTAALEGLRKRDDPNVTDPEQREQQRRQAASAMAAAVFAPNLDPANPDSNPLGAGPVLELSGGIGPTNAFQTIQPGHPPVYRPQLQLNLGNEQYGDMVAGTFVPVPANEDSGYNRSDFNPSSAGAAADAFLVRLRRTNDLQGLDNVPGVSSHGPTLPLVFGRGSMLSGGDPDAAYSIRHHGLTVRATAIAGTRRAMSIGTPFRGVDPPLPGVTPFVLDRISLWDTARFAANGTPVTATVDAMGNMTVITPGFGAGPHGRFLMSPPTMVGQEVPSAAAVGPDLSSPVIGYVPIYQSIVNGSGQPARVLVVGFGRVTLTLVSGTPGAGAFEVTLAKLPSIVAPENASAVPSARLNSLDTTELSNLMQAHQSFADPLLAAALVR